MTNKSYFKSLCSSRLYFGSYYLVFADKERCYNVPCKTFILDFEVYCIEFSPSPVFFTGSVVLTSRCIHTKISYYDVYQCKFSPYELNEWCPALFLPWTNYLHWLKYMRIALEIFFESNPKLLNHD